MPVTSWNSWPRLAVAVCALLGAVACAPNSARTPLEPRLAVATDGEREQGRYGTLLRLAASARAAGDRAAAVSLYQQAIEHNRSRTDAYVLLGETLLEMEAFNEAASTFQEALGRDRKNTAAHRGYARAMLGLNRPEVAVIHYQAVLGNAPNDLQAHNGLGVAFDLAGQHEAAQDAYRAGLASLRTACSCATIWACPWRSRVSTRRPSKRCARWPTNRGRRRATGRTWRWLTVWPGISRPPSG